MAFYDKFPYTNFQELNLDWIVSKIKHIDVTRDETEEMKNQAAASASMAAGSETAAAGSANAAAGSAAAAANSAERISNSLQQIDTNTANINRLIHRKFIFISDSYGEQTNSWIDNLVRILGLSSSDYYKSAVAGAGFAFGTTFETQLTNLTGTISDKDSITDIIIGGGFNDRSRADTTVKSAISSFVRYAKANFKNAAVHIGFIGWSFNSEFVTELLYNSVLNTYKQCNAYGANYISHSDEIMHDSGLFKEEDKGSYNLYLGHMYVHPNDAGALAIANCIANYIRCGTGVSYDGSPTVTPTILSGVTLTSGNFDLIMRKSGNNISVARSSYGLVTFHFSSPHDLNGDPIELAMLKSGLVAGVSTSDAITKATTYMPVTGFASSGGTNADFSGFLMIANNRIYLVCRLDNATTVSDFGLYGSAGNFNTNEV